MSTVNKILNEEGMILKPQKIIEEERNLPKTREEEEVDQQQSEIELQTRAAAPQRGGNSVKQALTTTTTTNNNNTLLTSSEAISPAADDDRWSILEDLYLIKFGCDAELDSGACNYEVFLCHHNLRKWQKISNRKLFQCFPRWQNKLRQFFFRRSSSTSNSAAATAAARSSYSSYYSWSQIEESALLDAIEKHLNANKINWDEISEYVNQKESNSSRRSAVECRLRWEMYVLAVATPTGMEPSLCWSDEELIRLWEFVMESFTGWAQIADYFGKDKLVCMSRWFVLQESYNAFLTLKFLRFIRTNHRQDQTTCINIHFASKCHQDLVYAKKGDVIEHDDQLSTSKDVVLHSIDRQGIDEKQKSWGKMSFVGREQWTLKTDELLVQIMEKHLIENKQAQWEKISTEMSLGVLRPVSKMDADDIRRRWMDIVEDYKTSFWTDKDIKWLCQTVPRYSWSKIALTLMKLKIDCICRYYMIHNCDNKGESYELFPLELTLSPLIKKNVQSELYPVPPSCTACSSLDNPSLFHGTCQNLRSFQNRNYEPSQATPISPINTACTKEEIRSADVLFGRGHGSSKSDGNIVFRSFIRKYQWLYRRSDSAGKKSIGSQLYYSWINSSGGRFLKQIEYSGEWEVASEKEAITKVRMTCRQKEKADKPVLDEYDNIVKRDKKKLEMLHAAVKDFERHMTYNTIDSSLPFIYGKEVP